MVQTTYPTWQLGYVYTTNSYNWGSAHVPIHSQHLHQAARRNHTCESWARSIRVEKDELEKSRSWLEKDELDIDNKAKYFSSSTDDAIQVVNATYSFKILEQAIDFYDFVFEQLLIFV